MRKWYVNGLIGLCLILCLVTGGFAKVWYVDANGPKLGTGDSWASPLRSIQTAVNKASSAWMICFAPEDQIWVKQGTYNLTSTINVNKAVTILGGFKGNETSSGRRNPDKYPSVVHGQNNVTCFNVTHFCEIDGLTIRNGNPHGIYIEATPVECDFNDLTPIIDNCKLMHNAATATRGGGIYDLESSPVTRDCEFSHNTAGGGGAWLTLDRNQRFKDALFWIMYPWQKDLMGVAPFQYITHLVILVMLRSKIAFLLTIHRIPEVVP